jgi:hypothetical protein
VSIAPGGYMVLPTSEVRLFWAVSVATCPPRHRFNLSIASLLKETADVDRFGDGFKYSVSYSRGANVTSTSAAFLLDTVPSGTPVSLRNVNSFGASPPASIIVWATCNELNRFGANTLSHVFDRSDTSILSKLLVNRFIV